MYKPLNYNILSPLSINSGAKLDTGIITTYSLYITIGLLFLLFLIFAPILIDTSMDSQIRIIIIYFCIYASCFTFYKKNFFFSILI